MNRKILHTPDGVRDIYGDECERKLALERNLRQVLCSYGYRDIETPAYEFFDVFGSEVGSTPSRELFKFFDREGNTLVLRPDFTPAIARAASTYFVDKDTPVRLCYLGNTYINNSSYQGRLKESTHMGAELIGDSSAEADAEILAMVIQTLLQAGLREFQISVSHASFFDGLTSSAGLDDETAEELRSLIRNRNGFGAEKLLLAKGVPQEDARVFSSLTSMFGGEEILEKIQTLPLCDTDIVRENLSRLRDILDILKIYRLERYISFDLGMLSNYRYYTGVIFRGYTYGTGDAIVKGGRYDALLQHFAKDMPAIGFVVTINQLMNAMARQKVSILSGQSRYLILYRRADREEAILRASDYRRQGQIAELMLIEDGRDAKPDEAYLADGGYLGIIRIGDLT